MEFSGAADELYGVLPTEFTATRKRLAAELPREDARRLTALRRPTVPAWAVNLLVRDDAIAPLLDLGERMRAAWSGGEGGDVGALERERTSLVDDLVRRARELAGEAGRPLTDAFADEVEQTLRAAIADPPAADAVRSGRLTHSLRHAGFGPFGAATPVGGRRQAAASSAPARTGEGKKKEAARRTREEREREERRRREEAERAAARRAEDAAREAERSLADWQDARDEALRRLTDAEAELTDLRERLRAAEARRTDLDRKARVAEREHERAARTAREARRHAERLDRSLPERPTA